MPATMAMASFQREAGAPGSLRCGRWRAEA